MENAQAEEHRAWVDAVAFYAARRKAYQAHGVRPLVPPGLSKNPYDEEFEFVEYVDFASEEGQNESDKTANSLKMKPDEVKVLGKPEETVRTVFVSAGGEKWRWKPKDLAKKRASYKDKCGQDKSGGFECPASLGVEDSVGFRALIGSDGRTVVGAASGQNMTLKYFKAHGVLVPDGTSTAYPTTGCSATKIGPRHLVTAAHCIVTEGGGSSSLRAKDWWGGADGTANTLFGYPVAPNGRKNIAWYTYDEYYSDEGWNSHDFAVLTLFDNQESCDFGWYGFRVHSSLAGRTMGLNGYPGQDFTCAGSPLSTGKCGGSLYYQSAKMTRTEVPYLFLSMIHKKAKAVARSGIKTLFS